MDAPQKQAEFRAKLWQDFLANYISVLNSAPHTFGIYCAQFRARYAAGR